MHRHTHRVLSSDVQMAQTRIGAGIFIVSRHFAGTCTAHDLLEQCVQQAAHKIIH